MSKVIIKLDNSGNVILPTMVLATRSGKKLGTILTEGNKLTGSLANGYSLSFIVNKYLDGHENNVWDSIDNFKLLYIPDWDIWFEMYVSISEKSSIVKEVECTSLCEAELSQIMLYNIEINTETDIAREDYEPTIIYNEKNPATSLLDRIMEKTPHYCIEHVDNSIAKLQRTFAFDGKSIRDSIHEVAEEINALLILNSGSNLDGTITRGISLYDLEEHCEDCGYRGKSSNGQCPECGSKNWSYGYGKDSGIFISSENLSNDIKLTTDTDKIKNCFKLVAGDDLMTATVAGCCPNGIGYLWYLTEETKNDMSAELRSRLDSYDRLTADIETRHWTLSDSNYSALATKYGKEKWDSIDGYADLLNAMYDTIDFQLYLEHSMMPDRTIPETTAQEQMNNLVADLSPVAVQNLSVLSSTTATSYIVQAIKAIVDPRYSVTTSEETLNGNNWSGTIKLTRSSDETDTVTRQNVRVTLNDDFVSYLKTLIDRTINTTKLEEFDIIKLFDMGISRFTEEIKRYSLSCLQTFYDATQSCLNVLIERGAGNDSISPEAYSTLYSTYYEKREALQNEIALREKEISTIEHKQYSVDGQINLVHDELDLEKYLGEKLWLELAAYRREDTYQNDNFISDGLSNAELFDKAREFIERAKADIENSNYGQHEITSSLYNLLLMPEFKKLRDGFDLGNWLRIRVDGEIYILRLAEYNIDFAPNNIQNISVTYSDVSAQNKFKNLTKGINDNYQSMASTYGNVSRQASHGNDSNKQLRSWVSDGLQATLTRFMSDAVNQNIMWDSNGMLFRRYDDITEDYSPEQLRIINSTIAVTDDNWKTVKTAVGGFDYLDPVTQKVKHGYGINAELLIGKLILGEELGLYNANNSLTFDRNGLTITNGDNSFMVSPDGNNLFVIECGEGNKVMWVDDEGGLHLRPTSFELTSGETLQDAIDEAKKARNLQIILTNEYEGVPTDAYGIYDGKLNIKTRVITYYGTEEVTKDCSYSISASEGVVSSWDDANFECTITDLNADKGYVNITAEYTNADGVGFSVTKQFNVSKAKAGANGRGITSATVSYTTSNQGNTPPQNGWQEDMPPLTPGLYLWTRTITSYNDNSTPTTSYSVSLIGADGEDGRGISSTVIEYQVGDSGTVVPTGAWSKNIPDTDPGEYLWTRTTFTFTDGSTDVAYSVSMKGLEGPQGPQGFEGKDGKNNYFHIKYMTEENYNNMLQYKAGHTEYTFVAQDTAAKYIGTNVTESPDPCENTNMAELARDYEWYDIKGVQGEKGLQGDGYYLHIKYMTEANYNLLQQYIKAGDARMHTVEMTEEDEDAKYIGQYVDKYVDGESHEDDSNDPTKYEWSRFKGDSSYFYVKYMSADDYHAYTEHPSTANVTLHDDPADIMSHPIFIGIYVGDVDLTTAAKINPNSYRWSQFEGENGIPGADGNFTHIKYMTAANYEAWVAAGKPKSWDRMQEVAADYLGMYTDKTEKDSSDPNAYQWTKVEGRDGKDGTSYRLDFSNNYIIRGQDGKVPVSAITVSSYRTSGDSAARMAVQSRFYLYYSTDGKIYTLVTSSADGITTWTPNISFLNETNYSNVTHLKISASVTNNENDVFDYQCIPIVRDGKDGADGSSGLTMVLSNEYEGVPVKSDGSFFSTPLNVRTKVVVSYGLTDVTGDCEFSEVKQNVVGDWSTTSGREYVITNLTADTGYVDITAKYLGTSITRRFSVSKVKDGADGQNGFTYFIESTAEAIRKNKDGTFTPDVVSFTIYQREGNSATKKEYSGGYYNILSSTDGMTFKVVDQKVTPSYKADSPAISTLDPNIVALRVIVSTSVGAYASSPIDIKTIPVISEGKDGKDGDSNLAMILTNEYEGVPVDSNGKPIHAVDVRTEISVSYGLEDITNDLGCTYNAVFHGVTGTWASVGKGFVINGFQDGYDSGYVDISVEFRGATVTKRFSASKVNNGADGSTYRIEVSAGAIKRDKAGAISPTSVNVKTYRTDGTNAAHNPINAYVTVWTSTDGVNFEQTSYNPANQSGRTIGIRGYITDDTVALQFKASLTDKPEEAFDIQTLPVISDGKDGANGENGLTMVLSNEYEGVPTNSEGVIDSSWSGAKTKVTVLDGIEDVTTKCTFGHKTSNVTGSWSETAFEYTITGMSADSGYVDITATYGSNNPITKRFNVAKVKSGTDGTPGRNGVTYTIEASAEVVKKNQDGTFTPEKVSFTIYSREGNSANKVEYKAGYYTILTSTDGETFRAIDIRTAASSKADSPAISSLGADVVAIRAVVSQTAGGYQTSPIDMKTVAILKDGVDGQDGKDVTDLTPEEVFNALTDHGRIQGIKMEGDSLYVNATYINSGTLSGDLIKGGTIQGATLNAGLISGGTIDGAVISGGSFSTTGLNSQNYPSWTEMTAGKVRGGYGYIIGQNETGIIQQGMMMAGTIQGMSIEAGGFLGLNVAQLCVSQYYLPSNATLYYCSTLDVSVIGANGMVMTLHFIKGLLTSIT